ncbi:MAG: YueI family protein [Desulfitobacterium sp.]|nr:YueI family protein [Desulfitobacterium sp.]
MNKNPNDVEQRLQIGIHGRPELKPEERARYLGEFRERVLRLLRKKQVQDKKVYPEIEEALKDARSVRLLLNGDLPYSHRVKYIEIARKYDKPYTVVNDPKLKGDAGLVVVSDDAIDVEKIEVD